MGEADHSSPTSGGRLACRTRSRAAHLGLEPGAADARGRLLQHLLPDLAPHPLILGKPAAAQKGPLPVPTPPPHWPQISQDECECRSCILEWLGDSGCIERRTILNIFSFCAFIFPNPIVGIPSLELQRRHRLLEVEFVLIFRVAAGAVLGAFCPSSNGPILLGF